MAPQWTKGNKSGRIRSKIRRAKRGSAATETSGTRQHELPSAPELDVTPSGNLKLPPITPGGSSSSSEATAAVMRIECSPHEYQNSANGIKSHDGKPNNGKADTVRVMVALELLSPAAGTIRHLLSKKDHPKSSTWSHIAIDVELPRHIQSWSNATAQELRQSLVSTAPLRPEEPFRLDGGRNSRVDVHRLNSPCGDALLSACGIETGTVLWCSPEHHQRDALPGSDQSKALIPLGPSPGEITLSMHGALSQDEVRKNAHLPPVPQSPCSNLPRLHFTNGQGESVGILSYMDCEANQYSLGAVSACTGMSVQAAFVVLRNLLRRQKDGVLHSNDYRPFGCTPDTLREILKSGSRYTGTSHLDVLEVLDARPDLTQSKSTDGRFLHHVQIGGGYVNVDPQNPQKGLSKGRDLMLQHGCSFAAIVTGAAQSVCVFFPAGSSQVFLFDSHPRTFGETRVSAAFYFFDSIGDMGDYIKGLLHVEGPADDDPVTAAEEAHLAILFSVAQADFFCLGPLEEMEAQHQSAVKKNSTPQPRHHDSRGGTGRAYGKAPLPSADMLLTGDRRQSQQQDKEIKVTDKAGDTGYKSGGAVPYPRIYRDGESFPNPDETQPSQCWPPTRQAVVQPIAPPWGAIHYQDSRATEEAGSLSFAKPTGHDNKGKMACGRRFSVHDTPHDHGASSSSQLSTSASLAVAELKQQTLEESLRKAKEENMRLVQDLECEKQESRSTKQAFQDLRVEHAQLREQVRYLKLQVSSLQQSLEDAKHAHSTGMQEEQRVVEEQRRRQEWQQQHQQQQRQNHHQQQQQEAADRRAAQDLQAEIRRHAADQSVAEELQQQQQEAAEQIRRAARQQAEMARQEADRRMALELQEDMARQEADQRMAEELQRDNERQIAEDQRLAEELQQSMMLACPLCCEEVPIDDVWPMDPCQHRTCRKCATRHLETQINDRRLPVICWDPQCRRELAENNITALVSDDVWELATHLSRTPTADPGFKQCPRPDCRGYYLMDADGPDDGACCCVVCEHRWCWCCQVSLGGSSQHANISCAEYQRWKRDNDSGDEAMEALLRAGLMDQNSPDRMRRCPRCSVPWMKDQACMHVVCEKMGGGCGVHFCFQCAIFHADEAMGIYNHQPTCQGYKPPGRP